MATYPPQFWSLVLLYCTADNHAARVIAGELPAELIREVDRPDRARGGGVGDVARQNSREYRRFVLAWSLERLLGDKAGQIADRLCTSSESPLRSSLLDSTLDTVMGEDFPGPRPEAVVGSYTTGLTRDLTKLTGEWASRGPGSPLPFTMYVIHPDTSKAQAMFSVKEYLPPKPMWPGERHIDVEASSGLGQKYPLYFDYVRRALTIIDRTRALAALPGVAARLRLYKKTYPGVSFTVAQGGQRAAVQCVPGAIHVFNPYWTFGFYLEPDAGQWLARLLLEALERQEWEEVDPRSWPDEQGAAALTSVGRTLKDTGGYKASDVHNNWERVCRAVRGGETFEAELRAVLAGM